MTLFYPDCGNNNWSTTQDANYFLDTGPYRISARRLTLRLPTDWPRETAWNTLFDNMFHRAYSIIA